MFFRDLPEQSKNLLGYPKFADDFDKSDKQAVESAVPVSGFGYGNGFRFARRFTRLLNAVLKHVLTISS